MTADLAMTTPDSPVGDSPPGMVWIPGGSFRMGCDDGYPEEGPAHRVHVDGFWMDRHTVTVAEFRDFVDATGYVTVAERPLCPEDYPGVDPADLVPGSAVFCPPRVPVDLTTDQGTWWHYQPGASWRHPEGPGSSVDGRGEHPVVHVCFEDAAAYAQWAGKSLPTEAQWERAARGGLEGLPYCWGDELYPDGRTLANIWQGTFPSDNRKARTPGTDPVGSFPSNGYGLFDMSGNVWEWTTDFWRPGHNVDSTKAVGSCCSVKRNPHGPETAWAEESTPDIPLRVLKGGSFLCASNYCARYRPAARISQASDTGSVHIGFRCVVVPAQAA